MVEHRREECFSISDTFTEDSKSTKGNNKTQWKMQFNHIQIEIYTTH